MAKIIKKFGVEFFGTSLRIKIEDGFNIIGETDWNPKRGTQVYYFKDEQDWEMHRRSVFEAQYTFDKPVPFFEAELTGNVEIPTLTPTAKVATVRMEDIKTEPVMTVIEPVAETKEEVASEVLDTQTEADPAAPSMSQIVAIINEGKKVRFKDVADRLNVDPELVKNIITETPKSPVTIGQGGWVSVIA